MAQKIRHRGPDWSGIYVGGSAILAHERLSIVDPQSGGQPLYSPDRKQILAVNGEIYNHRDIRAHYAGKYTFQTGSDCEVILALYKDKGINFLEELNGIFAFALYDEETDDYLIARDPIKAREVAQYIGTIHHEINYTIQEGLDAIRDVIYFIETYDVTTVRASTPMYLLARVIKSMGIKMVLSGEGADEVFGGYLYFHKAPTPQAFHEETVRKLSKLYLYDCLRANKSLAAWGVEGRVPFLDKEFLDVAMRLNPATKMCPGKEIEKKVVREAFADMLPESVAWRQKEQFSDGVGYSWIDTLKAVTAAAVSDEQMRKASERFPVNTPMNKEEYYYRTIFEEHFPSESAARSVPSVPSVACSTAEALAWDVSFQGKNDPSGRAVAGVHEEAYKD